MPFLIKHIGYFYLLIGLVNSGIIKSQNEFYNNGSAVTVQLGGLVYVQGEVINTDNGVNVGLINNAGTVTLSGDWTNNSTSSALVSTSGLVELNGALQLIKGTQPTTFNDLTLLGTNTKRLNINTFVGGTTGVLNLTARTLDLNSNTLFVTNPLSSAVVRTSGYILSETPAAPGYGTVQWNLGNNTGNYEFPFGTITANYIPFFYTIASAGSQSGVGSISASTYPTVTNAVINNRPLPSGVNNLLNNCNTDHAIKMLDRYWVINSNNYSTTPTVLKKMTYVDDEWNTFGGSTNQITEPNLYTWHYASSGWSTINSTNNAATNEQIISSNSDYGVFTLGEYKQLTLSLLNVDSVKCFGQNNGVIQFSATAGYDSNSYYWNSAATTDTIKTDLIAGSYTIIATDVMGCADTLNAITVFEPALLTQNLTSNDYSICRNQAVNLTSSYNGGIKPYTLNWSTGASSSNLNNATSVISSTPTSSTNYTATLTDKNNCVVTDTVFINVNQLPDINFDADVKEGCQPLEVQFINQSGNSPVISSYLWTFYQGYNSTDASPQVTFNNAGSYSISLKAISDSSCVNTITKNNFITVYERPRADFTFIPNNDIDILNSEIKFTNTTVGNYNSSSWMFGDGATSSETDPTHTYFEANFYNVTLIVSTIHNCTDIMIKQIAINEPPTVYIPNAFTPIGEDGLNDVFTIKGVNFLEFEMFIFDRWGEKILCTKDPITGWNGKYKDTYCQIGVYVYQISYKFLNGRESGAIKTHTGHVTLLK
ncbi:MAG: gliding motility-associated C-terminal domain-containing protein [Burkholderiales bacterium]|nr:gliding motility-associated C-terminal domain-containing protein [Bacteroidia bacterium]